MNPFFTTLSLTQRAFNRVIHHYKLLISRQKAQRFILDSAEVFLELGSGSKKGSNGWYTLDLAEGCDLYWDLNKGLPYPSNSIAKIYSSHVFEHFSFQEIQKLLEECFRVLKPGGKILICVPDAEIFIRAYYENRELNHDINIFVPAYSSTDCKIDYVNYVAYCGGAHKYMFDRQNIISILQLNGFEDAKLRDFDPMIDLEIRRAESLFVGALKPIKNNFC